MNNYKFSLILYLFPLLIALFSTAKLNPKIINLSKRWNLLDAPNVRKIHKFPISRIGGISIFLGFLISLVTFWIFIKINNDINFQFTSITRISLLSLILFFLMGLWDDLYSLSPFIRLACQFLISSGLWFLGFQINNIDLSIFNIIPFSIDFTSWVSYLITIFWMVGVTNAFNWIDGLDGLASSISLIASLSLMLICITLGKIETYILLSIIVGNNIGFLFKNKYPAKLLMGDSGSYFLGFSYAIFSITAISEVSPNGQNLSFVIPLFIILVPFVDMIFVILYRLFKGFSPFIADNSHIHHRLLQMGLSHLRTVKVIVFIHYIICTNVLLFLQIIKIEVYLFSYLGAFFILKSNLEKIKPSNHN